MQTFIRLASVVPGIAGEGGLKTPSFPFKQVKKPGLNRVRVKVKLYQFFFHFTSHQGG